MKRYLTLLFFFFFLSLFQVIYAQSDSTANNLEIALNQAESDEERLKITLQLSEEFYKTTPSLALKYARESERLAKNIHSNSSLNNAYVNQATAYLHMGNYPQALQLYFKAIDGARKLDDSYTLFLAYEKLGILYHYQKNNKKALEYYFAALNQFSPKKPNIKKQIERKAYLLKNIGVAYNETKRYTESANYFNQALSLSKQLNDHELIANILNNQGTLYRDLGNNQLALKRYKEAMEIRRENNNKWGLSSSYLNIGQFYFNQKDYEIAATYLKEAIELGKEIEYWPNVSASSSSLFQLYKEKGDYKNALEALELNRNVNDTLFSQDRIRKTRQLEMQFEFDHKQAELKAQQYEKDLYYWIIGMVLLLSLIIVSLFLLLQRNKARNTQLQQMHLQLEKRNLENDLAIKDKELATNVMYLLNKNELINGISEKLHELKKNLGDESQQQAVQRIAMELQSQRQPELLEEFEFRFQQVHEQFYKNLNEKFPTLTPNERRLCALLKLNMSTKEISAFTHQNAKAVDVARTRLRKKLNLTGTDKNLSNYLSHLDYSL